MRTRAMTSIVVLAAASAMALAGCASSSKKTTTARPAASAAAAAAAATSGGTTTAGQTYTLGFIGALSGPNAQLGINERNGAQLAIDQANASGKYKFKVTLDPQDSEGDPAKAPAAATALISDASVIGVIGPAFSGESKAVDPSFCGASPSMPIVTASASNATLQHRRATSAGTASSRTTTSRVRRVPTGSPAPARRRSSSSTT